MSLLKDKPLWAYWVVYSTLSAVLFGAFYATMFLLASRWWVAIIVIAGIGMIWGSVEFTKKSQIEKSMQ
jgi:apolipoprotein N-acyltransferase